MNIHTFKDAADNRRSALINELEEDDNDDEDDRLTEGARGRRRESIEGEEEDGTNDKYDDMGGKVEPFNLKNEREVGGFDENMNFVFHKEKGEVDAWLADMDESQMEKGIGEAAKAYKLKQDKKEAEEKEESKKQEATTSSLKEELVGLLHTNENIWQAMRRLGAKNAEKSATDGDNTSKINRLTELADMLLGRGETNIYEMTREGVILSDIEWEYRGKDDQIYGAYTSRQIRDWIEGGFFTGDSAVLMRRARTKKEPSSRNNKKTITWSDSSNSDDKGGYEESKSSSETKRRRDDFKNNDGGQPIKRNRLETSEDLLNDLEDSDDEDDPYQVSSVQTISENAPNTLQYDEYDEWQSSDDIDWSLITSTQEERDVA